jgi:hypothetical protein
MIDNLQQILLNKYEWIGLEGGYPDPLTRDHQFRTVGEGTSWKAAENPTALHTSGLYYHQ